MPIVRIDFLEGKSPEYGVRVGLIVARRKEDILINLVEVPKENWPFGNGESQYAPVPPLTT